MSEPKLEAFVDGVIAALSPHPIEKQARAVAFLLGVANSPMVKYAAGGFMGGMNDIGQAAETGARDLMHSGSDFMQGQFENAPRFDVGSGMLSSMGGMGALGALGGALYTGMSDPDSQGKKHWMRNMLMAGIPMAALPYLAQWYVNRQDGKQHPGQQGDPAGELGAGGGVRIPPRVGVSPATAPGADIAGELGGRSPEPLASNGADIQKGMAHPLGAGTPESVVKPPVQQPVVPPPVKAVTPAPPVV